MKGKIATCIKKQVISETIAERYFNHKNIVRVISMPDSNKGYDFITVDNKKIEVKSANINGYAPICLSSNKIYRHQKNKICDAFIIYDEYKNKLHYIENKHLPINRLSISITEKGRFKSLIKTIDLCCKNNFTEKDIKEILLQFYNRSRRHNSDMLNKYLNKRMKKGARYFYKKFVFYMRKKHYLFD